MTVRRAPAQILAPVRQLLAGLWRKPPDRDDDGRLRGGGRDRKLERSQLRLYRSRRSEAAS